MKLLLAIAAASISFAQSANQNGSLSGTVIRFHHPSAHQPIKKAIVSTQLNMITVSGVTSRTVVTDALGSFTLDDLPPGDLTIFVTHPSYSQGQPVAKTVQIAAGEKAGPLTVELIPGASVSGRIVDEDGDPLPGCQIQLRGPDPRRGVQMQGQFNSNEEGEYHLRDIRPGKYTVSAHCEQPVFRPRPFSSGPNPPASVSYPDQYYPLAPDEKSAETITLAAGSEKTGVDFRMRPSPVTYVRVAFTGIDVTDRDVMVALVPEGSAWTPLRAGWRGANMSKGIATVERVFPGSYRLLALRNGAAQDRFAGFSESK